MANGRLLTFKQTITAFNLALDIEHGANELRKACLPNRPSRHAVGKKMRVLLKTITSLEPLAKRYR